ncbi:SDR family NAD(P)-dependent oxidoreductase [Moorella sp. ACPs]|uniref:SDR family NAD(P)-dependent oxidoreductase n=1 Tax=Neomoorella carbonis TaxID=3062783 RepID=UPI00324A8109
MKFPALDVKDKVALVTGSTKGIGYGIALALAENGADLIITSRHQEDCEKVAETIRGMGRRALAKASDVTDAASIKALVEAAIKEYGRIDVLVNNAGTAITKRAEDLEEADWNRVINVDLKGVFLCSIEVGKQMIAQKKGKIINVASILGLVGERMVLPYCVAKGGVIQMTRALALEWARYNIQVNAICPGYVLTPMNEADIKGNEKIYNNIIKKTPLRRLGEIEDMVGAVIYLASEASNYMTGQIMVVDGGWTAE